MDELQSYGGQSQLFLKKHGAVKVSGYNVEASVGSDEKPAMIGIFSFPNREAIQNLLVNDPEYQKIVPLRDKGFKSIKFFIGSESV